MALPDRTLVVTPEGVTHELRLAGLGSRLSAALVDGVVWFVVILLLGAIAGSGDGEISGDLGTAAVTLLLFALIFGYFAVFEAVWRGRTPGKRLNGLRVVTEDGSPIGFRRAAIRNLIRIVDFLPMAYLIGMVSIGSSPRGQRLGDLAAGTVVVVEPTKARRRKAALASKTLAERVPLTDVQLAELMTWDVTAVTREEAGMVLQFVERRDTIDADARQRLASEFARRLRPKVVGVPPQLTDERFLELVVRAKQQRRRRMMFPMRIWS